MQLQNQPASLSWADALEVPSIRKSFIKLTDQKYSLKTIALKCNVTVEAYTILTIVDSNVVISIITHDVMEQLRYEIEEASKKKFSELIENTDEKGTNENDTKTEKSENDDEEIIFKNTIIENDDNENNKDIIPVFLNTKWFTTLDLASEYWQVKMDSKNQDKTAFITK
ncbi:hypothetical protein Glove_757g19 [Diversispora epigaea]|uniref:Reverse transcriptase domain-containing protein n=1 Tax=Diversispora epigaea TaxID=1348612 RepID=A0A397G072_9GLOM|nr:hypothetical protein Glove_757g19 [Diversispora epigaea]